MANRAYPLAAIATALILAFLTLGSAVVVASQASTWALGPADWAALRFTVEQAALSAGISGFLAIPVARALARRSFVGRGTLIRLMAAPFLLPVVVAVLGLPIETIGSKFGELPRLPPVPTHRIGSS